MKIQVSGLVPISLLISSCCCCCCCCCCCVASVMSDSVQPHKQQPTRLPRPWDSPIKNTGVGCHFLLQCMKVKSESEVAQSCPTLSDPMDCTLPGSSIHGIFQARVLEWGAIAFSVMDIYLAPKLFKLYTLTMYRFLYISHTSWKNKPVPNWERSTSRLYIVTLLI